MNDRPVNENAQECVLSFSGQIGLFSIKFGLTYLLADYLYDNLIGLFSAGIECDKSTI